MKVYDGFFAVDGRPTTEALGLDRFENITDWGLFPRVDGVFDYTRFDDDKLRVIANKGCLCCLDDEELFHKKLITKEQADAERARAVDVILSENPDCQFGFLSWTDTPGVTHIFVCHYFTKDPHEGFTPIIHESGLPVIPFVWWCWADYGTVPADKHALIIDPETWRETLEFCKANYEGVVLWDAGSWRTTGSGPRVDSTWDLPAFQELWEVTKDVLLKGNIMVGKAKINDLIALEKTVLQPNGIYCPMIMFATGIGSGGKLQTSCQIQFAAGKMVVDKDGIETWKATGHTETIYISNIDNLEPDLAVTLGDPFAKAYADVLAMVAAINVTRKVL